jgi:membrane protein DedA with SNARE-associated domain
MSHLSWQKFALWNFIAAFVWAVAFSNIGYLFGDLIEHVPEGEDKLASVIHQVMVGILAFFTLFMVMRFISARLQKHHSDRAADKSK